jgi:hypothetical protein
MKAAHAGPQHGRRRLDGHGDVAALLVDVGEFAVVRADRVVDAQQGAIERVRHRVFEIDHDGGRPGVEQLHDELVVVGRAGHLVALIGAPCGHLDAPVALCIRRRRIVRFAAVLRCLQDSSACGDRCLLARRKRLVERTVKRRESRGKVAFD